MNNKPIKVLIVDDSIIFRKILEETVTGIDNAEVVGSVYSGRKAIEFITNNQIPDVITLDMEMPELSGLETLKAIRELKSTNIECKKIKVIIVSSQNQKDADTAIEALENGAFDFISKPKSSDIKDSLSILRNQLIEKFTYLSEKPIKNYKELAKAFTKSNEIIAKSSHKYDIEIVAFGVSTGGPKALFTIIPQITKKINLPILIVQHMPPAFTKSLADNLAKRCDFKVIEARGNELIQNRHIYIAPGGRHMIVRRSSESKTIIGINDNPPENDCKPSVDVLFRSIANVYGSKAIVSILTGMGSDGVKGLEPLKRAGAFIIAQDEESSTVWGMPGRAIESGNVDRVLPLDKIPTAIDLIVKNE
jgi:two-component system chemotaxis response regulator CheB